MKHCKQCNKVLSGKKQYCDDACRMAYSRKANKQPEQMQPEQAKPNTCYEAIAGSTVYNRQAVKCPTYMTRPMPLDPADQPHPGGRGKYTRQDGTTYQFDSSGTASTCHCQDNAESTATLEHYQANPDQYIARADAERLNWGKRMNMNELNIAGKKANRVPIPGDWDYEGAAV